MSNQTIYPYGTDGELPSSIGIINDLVTGGADNALSAEQGKVLNDKFNEQFGEVTNVVSSTYFTNRVYNKNGSYKDSGSATPYIYTIVFPILNPSYYYNVSFRSIGYINYYTNCVSILMLDDNDNVIGWLFDQAWSGGVANDYVDYYIGQLPSGTTKIYVYSGYNQDFASVKYDDGNTINLPSALSEIDTSINKLRDSIYYFIETPVKTYGGKSLLNTGGLSSLSTYTTYEYELKDGVKYTVDLNVATSSYPNNVGLCYYDDAMNLISFDCPARTNSNEERNLLFNYQLNVPTNAKYVRVARSTSAQSTYDMQLRSYANSKLFGKKIAVIGDSISTHGVFTTPYKRVTESDVGVTIQSYVTYYDSHNQAGNSITKTIGGVTLTDAMNDGELHSFTPTSADVGKSIGIPKYYTNNDSVLTWVDIMARCLGARVIANASFSGSSITTSSEARGSQYINCASWKDYTLSRCRDNFFGSSSFELESPDIIIIYRGTNDFSYTNNSTWGAQTLDEPNLLNGLDYSNYTNDIKDNSYQFKEAYYVLINRLREMYPTAIIVLATLNVFKRVNYSSWPTRNDVYTLPDYNNAIRDVANNMGCLLIELDKDGITFQNCYSEGYITDSATTPTHPNQKGHWVMGVKAASDIDYALSTNTFEL